MNQFRKYLYLSFFFLSLFFLGLTTYLTLSPKSQDVRSKAEDTIQLIPTTMSIPTPTLALTSAPSAPQISLNNLPCIIKNNLGNKISISWQTMQGNSTSSLIYADVSLNSDFSTYYRKTIVPGSYSTQGDAFKNPPGSGIHFTYNPNTTYYVRFYNGIYSPSSAFIIPKCP